jgi:hypothetical protein
MYSKSYTGDYETEGLSKQIDDAGKKDRNQWKGKPKRDNNAHKNKSKEL